ncbi:hypothetical protein ACN6MT_01825 [Neobacillus niacini]|uniref:hypothetical protein n=1 Tax=Neobacillus niacini TaxID=86668 RepID=UPI003B028015
MQWSKDLSSMEGLGDKTHAVVKGFVLNGGSWGQNACSGQWICPQWRVLGTKRMQWSKDLSSMEGLGDKTQQLSEGFVLNRWS